MINQVEQLADAIINDVNAGLRGLHTNMSMSKEQLMLDVVDERLLIIKEYTLKGILPIQDLMVSINCIPVDCDDLSKCRCNSSTCGSPTAHFEIPLILLDWGADKSIRYIGSVDKKHSFLFYTLPIDKVLNYLKYRKRGKNKPWVYIDSTPNSRGMFDCYIFGAPLIKLVSVVAIFKDLRLLEEFSCCGEEEINQTDNNYSFFNALIKDRLTRKKIMYYRQYAPQPLPNDQQYIAG